jgi:hypothetical protein
MRMLLGSLLVGAAVVSAAPPAAASKSAGRQPSPPLHYWTDRADPFAAAFVQAQENQPNADADPHKKEDGPVRAVQREPSVVAPSVFAGAPFGGILFAVGLLGWIALAVSVVVLERLRPARA